MNNEDILEEKLMQKIRQAKYYKRQTEELRAVIDEAIKYVEKMSYCDVVDNPKKDLIKILKKENK